MTKRIRIAVVGERASGKSYLLYDLIHAFGLLGYAPEQLPLSYPHSSFGTYFYDTFNSKTGGMRGTERYACRPDNHYAAWLSKGKVGRRLEVDFLNIPGEVFNMSEEVMGMFFTLRQFIEKRDKGVFYLSTWRNPAGKETKLIVYKELDLVKGYTSVEATSNYRFGNYIGWSHLRHELSMGQYQEVSRKPVSGRYMLSHLTELQTDSVLLTLEHCWDLLTLRQTAALEDYKARMVFFYFYPLVYCQQATDLVICDNLVHGASVGRLAEHVAHFMKEGNHRPHAYLAFRGADKLLVNFPGNKEAQLLPIISSEPSSRNKVYEWMMADLQKQILEGTIGNMARFPSGWEKHVKQSLGDGVGRAFWHLLNASMAEGVVPRLLAKINNQKSPYELLRESEKRLPPHVYFTASPIDAAFRIYQNDKDDVTRFYWEGDEQLKVFTLEVNSGREQHLCLGSYQLLTDILCQNGVSSEGLRQRGEHLLYMQSKM